MSNYNIGDIVSVYIFAPQNWENHEKTQRKMGKVRPDQVGRVSVKDLSYKPIIGMPIDQRWGSNNPNDVKKISIKIIGIKGEGVDKKYKVEGIKGGVPVGLPPTFGLSGSSRFPNASSEFIKENQIIGLAKVGKMHSSHAVVAAPNRSKSKNLKFATDFAFWISKGEKSKLPRIVILSDDLLWAVESDRWTAYDETTTYQKLIRDGNNALTVIDNAIAQTSELAAMSLDTKPNYPGDKAKITLSKLAKLIKSDLGRLIQKINRQDLMKDKAGAAVAHAKQDIYIPNAIRESGEMSEYENTKENFLKQMRHTDSDPNEHQRKINALHDTLRTMEKKANVPDKERTHKSAFLGLGTKTYRERPGAPYKPTQKYAGGRKTRKRHIRKRKTRKRKTRKMKFQKRRKSRIKSRIKSKGKRKTKKYRMKGG